LEDRQDKILSRGFELHPGGEDMQLECQGALPGGILEPELN
jgi:hypothetical protein